MKILKLLPVIGLFIFAYLVYKIGLANIYKALLTTNIYYVAFAFLILLLAMFFLAFKWFVILKLQKIDINFLYVLKIYMIGVFYGSITPARSGSVIRASYLKDKINKPIGEFLSGIVLERMMDLLVLFLFSIIGCMVLSKYISSWILPIIVAFIIFILLFMLLLKKRISSIFLQFIYKFLIPSQFKEKSREIYHSFYSNLLSFKKGLIIFILTVVTWVILGIHLYTLSKSYLINIPLYYMILVMSMVTIISLIPITIGGLGTREAAQIFLFSLFGVPPAKVMSLSFLGIIMASVFLPFIGFLLSIKEKSPEKLV